MPRVAQIFEQSSGMRQVCVSFFFSDHCIKQIDSMLPWICSVIDHRGRQNVVKTSVTTLPCFQHVLTSSVIYYWTDARQHRIYLLNDARSRFWIWLGEYSSYVIMFCDQSQQRSGHATKPQIKVLAWGLVFSVPDWLFPCNAITFQKYRWCSRFCRFDS